MPLARKCLWSLQGMSNSPDSPVTNTKGRAELGGPCVFVGNVEGVAGVIEGIVGDLAAG